MEPEFQPYGLPHLTVIFLTIVLPFALAAIVRRAKSQRVENGVAIALALQALRGRAARRLVRRSVRKRLRRNCPGRVHSMKARPGRGRDEQARATNLCHRPRAAH